jgi:hypothetical protein
VTNAPASTPSEPRVRSSRPLLPGWRAVLLQQLRATGFVLRRPAQIAAGLAIIATITIAVRIASRGLTFDLDAEPSPVYGLVGALLPIAVWMRDERFGPGFLWTLPVDRRLHALTKVFAGWLWLMGGVALSLLWLVAITMASGGEVLPAETIHLLDGSRPPSDPVDPASLRSMTWDPGVIMAAVPFTAATAAYLLASAFWLGTRHPVRWMIGAVLAVGLSVVASDIASSQLGMDWLALVPERALKWLIENPFGLDALLTAQTATLDSGMRMPTGERVSVWEAAPDLSHWRNATLLWTGLGLVGLWAAASRHREQRRA